MTPLNEAIVELQLVADQSYARGMALLLQHEEGALRPHAMDDHQTQVVGELLDAIDRIKPGLGTTLMQAMYPLVAPELLALHGPRAKPEHCNG